MLQQLHDNNNNLQFCISRVCFADASNDVFFVEYEPLSHSFSCQFVGHYENITCEVTYGPVDPAGQTCSLENQVTQMNSSDNALIDAVIVHIPSLAQTDHESKLFCFRAVGTTSMFIVGVEGSFTIGNEINTDKCITLSS